MNIFQIRVEHVKRGVFLVLLAAILYWFGIPWYYGNQTEIKNNLTGSAKVRGSKLYKSEGSLTFSDRQFYLNKKPLRILSGAMHYFRVVPEYWKDRMLKMKACGLNTLETYVSWNLHEKNPGQFDFDGILNVREYIRLAHEVGLYVIFRPGPYICSEWDFGGLPSWLLADQNMKVRSNYQPYKDAVERFFSKLLPLVKDLQYMYGGPIIAVQVENEFGSYSSETEHLLFIKEVMQKYGMKELFITSDGRTHDGRIGMEQAPFHEHALPTANFKDFNSGKEALDFIKSLSPDFPVLVTEFWSGWFDHWGQPHESDATSKVLSNLEKILDSGASVNFYMFHGGTNFGFMAGANYFKEDGYKPDTTSYDYDAPISEAGDCTEKYHSIRDLLSKKVLEPQGIRTIDKVPANTEKKAYGTHQIGSFMSWDNMISYLMQEKVTSEYPVYMEKIKRADEQVFQQYGYILYRRKINNLKDITISAPPRDRLQVLINGRGLGFYNWTSGDRIELQFKDGSRVVKDTLDLLVENLGRVNYDVIGSSVLNQQRKGLSGKVYNNNEGTMDWEIYPLDFNINYLNRVSISEKYLPLAGVVQAPALFRFELKIQDDPKDTFLSMKGWGKGVVFINKSNLGRYWEIGPQKTLFVPAPILKKGANQVLIFEEYKSANSVEFVDQPNLTGR